MVGNQISNVSKSMNSVVKSWIWILKYDFNEVIVGREFQITHRDQLYQKNHTKMFPPCLSKMLKGRCLDTVFGSCYQGISSVSGLVSSLKNLPVGPFWSINAYFAIRFAAISTFPPL